MGKATIQQLEAEGWTRQFTASGPRLDEAIENYEALGFEVKAVPVQELDLNDCSVCFDDENDRTVMIFTRKLHNQ